jgi:hypothetical protein
MSSLSGEVTEPHTEGFCIICGSKVGCPGRDLCFECYEEHEA